MRPVNHDVILKTEAWNTIFIALVCHFASTAAVCQLPDFFKDRLFLEYVSGQRYAQVEFRDDQLLVYTYDNRLQNGTCDATRAFGRRLIYLHHSATCHVITPMEHNRAILLETKTAQASVDECNTSPGATSYFTLLPAVDQLNNFVLCPFTNAKYQAVFKDSANAEHCTGDESSKVTIMGNAIQFEVCTSASAAGPTTRPTTRMHCADNLVGSFDHENADGGILLLNSFRQSELFPVASHCARYKIDGQTIYMSIATSPVSADRLISAYCMNDQSPTTNTDNTFALTLTVTSLIEDPDSTPEAPPFWMFWLSEYTLYPVLGGAVLVFLCCIWCCICKSRRRRMSDYDEEPSSPSDRQRLSSAWSAAAGMSRDSRFETLQTSMNGPGSTDQISNAFMSYDKELMSATQVDDASRIPSSSPSRKASVMDGDKKKSLTLLEADAISDVAHTGSSASQ